MQPNRALILLGGEFSPSDWLRALYRPDDTVIAADRGALLCEAARLPLDIMVGDFDSLPAAAELSCAQPKEIKRFPTDKDFSDGELALLCAKQRRCREAVFISALGGRLDHCLFNVIALLEKADRLGLTAWIYTPRTAAMQVSAGQERRLNFPDNSWCSIISLEQRSTVALQGMLYSGTALTLERASTRGLSNRIINSHQAHISVASGRVLAVVSSCSEDLLPVSS